MCGPHRVEPRRRDRLARQRSATSMTGSGKIQEGIATIIRAHRQSGVADMNALVDKVAIVTGASSGIGFATAKLFAREGARVVVNGRRKAELGALVAQILGDGGQAIAVAGDVRDEQLAKTLVETAVGRFGGLDIAFNNAGSVGEMGPIGDLSLAGWRDA